MQTITQIVNFVCNLFLKLIEVFNMILIINKH